MVYHDDKYQIFLYNLEFHYIVAACENMISGTGVRPGDIWTTSNGKTIEVTKTDAEGKQNVLQLLDHVILFVQ